MGIVQEKFQAELPENRNDDSNSGWVSDASARVAKGALGERLNQMPPGTNIKNQKNSLQNDMDMVMSGESDVAKDYNEGAINKGFTKRKMRPTDDMYTREHNDAFYDDVGGFVERNNMLDRL